MNERRLKLTPSSARVSEPTLEDVSRLAGVSTATISRAINSPDMVASATRERVRRAIEATGYVPNLLARGLASSRTKLIAVLVPGIAASLLNETIEAMTLELASAGYMVVLGLARGEAEMSETLNALLARRPDGLILTSSEQSPAIRRRLKTSGVTVIEIWDLPLRPLDVTIGFSHEAAGRAIADYVVGRGYRRALVISSNLPRARLRMKGFVDGCRDHGLEPPACDVRETDSFSINGRERLAHHLDQGGRPDVVVCSSDLVALGVLAEAAARGVATPAQLAVMGFGASEASAYTYPALTTVRIDGGEIGKQAAQVMIARSKGETLARRRINVGFEIIARDSC